jgi:hypothetical protein
VAEVHGGGFRISDDVARSSRVFRLVLSGLVNVKAIVSYRKALQSPPELFESLKRTIRAL